MKRPACLVLAGDVTGSCAVEPEDERTGTARAAICHGSAADDDLPAVGEVWVRYPGSPSFP